MAETWVVNASPPILLARIGQLAWLEGHDHRLGQNRCSLDGAELAKCNPGSSGRKDDHGRLERLAHVVWVLETVIREVEPVKTRIHPPCGD